MTDPLHKGCKTKDSGINSKSHLKQNRALWLREIEFPSAKRWGSHSQRNSFLKAQGRRLASSWSGHSWWKKTPIFRVLCFVLGLGWQVRKGELWVKEEARNEEKKAGPLDSEFLVVLSRRYPNDSFKALKLPHHTISNIDVVRTGRGKSWRPSAHLGAWQELEDEVREKPRAQTIRQEGNYL